MALKRLFSSFFNSEKSGGLVLVFITILSLSLANSPWQTSYINLWNFDIGGHSIVHWINDGLMTLFFLFIGLQLEREIYNGKLSSLKSVALPFFGALGGMIIPAGLYLWLNFGTDTQTGAGIPMATDIAFAIGILSLIGKRIPTSLKIFLTALAIMDDLGAIIIIAIFYTTSISFVNLFIALGIFGFLLILNQLKVRKLIPYLVGGVAMWYFMLKSGVHPTITGVLLAFAVTFGKGGEKSSSSILQNFLNKPVTFLVLPLFAMANTSISFSDSWLSGLAQASSLGIIVGLVIGKPLGIWLFSLLGVKLRLCTLPTELKWRNIIGVGFLAGIGFTMSIFITLLAFNDTEIVNNSKIAIIVASIAAGIIGFLLLKNTLKASVENDDPT
ncbi:Na+/H+ antiporter NhaA [uncultured Flavobacterium sp.]|uniref:Na+/H+ antiporter NhaA n=1 Tax=uncultured Flavobacterium sp. TaxID=165435 RepID=UPI0030EBC847|tara:strand:+ start:51170 stop:52327 length:1158 start_codon:yes stop_codon:yes gene_type:complete